MKLSLFFSSVLGVALVSACNSQVSAQAAWHHANDPSDQNISKEASRLSDGQPPIIGGGSSRNRREADLQQVQDSQDWYDAILQGEALQKAGKTEAALDSFQRSMDYIPNDPLALQRIAETYAAIGRLSEANQTYHKLFYEANWQSVGGTPNVYLGYALVLAKTGNPIEALKFYQEGAARLNYLDGKQHLKVLLPAFGNADGLLPYTSQSLQAMAHVGIAVSSQDAKEKEAQLDEAIRLQPDFPQAYYYKGQALSVKPGRSREALADYQKARLLAGIDTQLVIDQVVKESKLERNAAWEAASEKPTQK